MCFFRFFIIFRVLTKAKLVSFSTWVFWGLQCYILNLLTIFSINAFVITFGYFNYDLIVFICLEHMRLHQDPSSKKSLIKMIGS